MHSTDPKPTPDRILERDGRVHVGWFERPFVDAILQDAPPARNVVELRTRPFTNNARVLRPAAACLG